MLLADSKIVALGVGFIIFNHCYGALAYGGLQYGFNNGKCRALDVEDIIRTVYSKFLTDRMIPPALIRIQFQDCFVNVKLPVDDETECLSFDLRPSDAINIAVRCKVPIQVNKFLTIEDWEAIRLGGWYTPSALHGIKEPSSPADLISSTPCILQNRKASFNSEIKNQKSASIFILEIEIRKLFSSCILKQNSNLQVASGKQG
ncbi:hypothetical protein L1887_38845 [Cichorium endivia]|nr:hypothetical protein L1887_38845 [Cichorium endivia]